MKHKFMLFLLSGALILAGCSKSGSHNSETATVALKDGTSFTGAVKKSDTSAITLTGANGETRTYPMSQVDSVQYAASAVAPDASAATGGQAPAATQATAPAPPAPVPVRTIPAGAKISVRNSDRIKAGVAQVGQKFPGVIVGDVIGTDGAVAIPKGSDAMLIVRASQGQGKVKGQSEIALDLDSVTVAGTPYNLETADIVEKGKQGVGKNKRSGKFIGGGALLGTVIGAVAGGGKGALIGAAAGGGAGAGAQALTRGKAISIPSETILSFRLEAPVEIQPAQ